MENKTSSDILTARKLIDEFVKRTGVSSDNGDKNQRYLWTDAFAVQALFGLSKIFPDENYREIALTLIKLVHETLGKFRENDERSGWISGYSEKKGQEHPTVAGLRIGKKLPERKENEAFDQRLEWERDGQYFHYITRWINALLQAHKETGEDNYSLWAAELCKAGAKFTDRSNGALHMYWKMNTDLSKPMVLTMGAHDPLEGLITCESTRLVAPEQSASLEELSRDYEVICAGQKWDTYDSLGIGGLLLNTVRTAELTLTEVLLPEAIRPGKLLEESIRSLNHYLAIEYDADEPAANRLAFRECGLSLGVNVINGLSDRYKNLLIPLDKADQFMPLTDEIENFWINKQNQFVQSWTEHLDINAVTLACSIIAKQQPGVFVQV